MIKNYVKIAWRNLLKNKTFSFINIFGLAVGLASFILISLYISDELSYDKFYPNVGRIYRINSDISFGGSDLHLAQNADPFGPTIKKDYQEVEQFTRIYANTGSRMIRRGSEFINEAGFTYADSTFFDVFTLPILEGNPKTALNAPNSIALSKTAATKYFGSPVLAIGKKLEIQNENLETFNITAVYNDIPTNAHFNFDFIASMKNANYDFGNFLSHNFHTYIRLAKGVDYKVFEKKFDDVILKEILPQTKKYMNIVSMDEFRKAGKDLKYSLIPLTDIHLKSDRSGELSANSSMQYIYIFGSVALFLLLIACINFMNLSTARSTNRAKEVGVRKVMGTNRQTLIGQFISESALTSYISFGFALILVAIFLPSFNDLASKSFTFSSLLQPNVLPFLLLLPFVVGIIAGYYPAFFLSSFQPIEVMKGKLNIGSSRSNLRNVLVLFQFAISLTLIISTIIVYRQLNYIQNKNIGFNKDQMLVLNGTYYLQNNSEAFKNEVLGMAGVKGGSYADFLPVDNSSRSDNTFSKDPIMSNTNSISMQIWKIDHDYIPNLSMEMSSGRNFSREYGSDSSGIILNEAAVKQFGFTDPIGKYIYEGADNGLKIVGVVKDFHYSSLRENVGPLAMRLSKNGYTMAFKIDTENTNQLISQIEAKWKALAPSMPFSYEFLDESFDKMYRAEQRIGKVALACALLTILIACLGLFGLITYITQQRIKEIGIRKVLGASLPSIVRLLSKDFLKLVLFAIIVASPISYYFMNSWLNDFALRTNIEWWIFALSGISTLIIALFTVSYQAIKAALMNPIKSLKTE